MQSVGILSYLNLLLLKVNLCEYNGYMLMRFRVTKVVCYYSITHHGNIYYLHPRRIKVKQMQERRSKMALFAMPQ